MVSEWKREPDSLEIRFHLAKLKELGVDVNLTRHRLIESNYTQARRIEKQREELAKLQLVIGEIRRERERYAIKAGLLESALKAEIAGTACGEECYGGYRKCLGCERRVKQALS